jgi:tRNA-specific 2-thiouridylase
VNVKIRYKSSEAAAVLHPKGDGAVIRFIRPQRSVTPGQAAVFFQGDVLLGGGTIEPGVDSGVPEDQPAATT